MAARKLHAWSADAWSLARRQHGVVTRRQLLALGATPAAIRHRLASGRLHPWGRGVYAVGRPGLGREGRWMAAVLTCGEEARLSHRSAAELWGIWRGGAVTEIEVTIPNRRASRRPGVMVRRGRIGDERARIVDRIPVTDPISTLIDLASCASKAEVEYAIGEADHRDLADPESLFEALDPGSRRPGERRLWNLLERQRTRLAASELERRLLRTVARGGLPAPDPTSSGCAPRA